MKILAIGDSCGSLGGEAVRKWLPTLKKEKRIDFTVINGENSADGNGITRESAEMLFACGADVITGGNHSMRRKSAFSLLDENDCVLRPANLEGEAAGKGYCLADLGYTSVAVINLLGRIYLERVAASNPFIAAYDAAASIFRAQENTRDPMLISMVSNVMNIVGNAIMIWGFHMGVARAALATLISRIFCAVVVLAELRLDRQPIVVRDYLKIRPDWRMIRRILGIGIPSGVENSMFQLGKLAIQSTVSTLGTTAIAAQAMTNILENLNGIGGIGVGIGLMTIVGQCLGADRKDEAVYYIKKLCVIAEIVMAASCVIVFALTKPITILGGMEPESAKMCFHMVMWITIVKPLAWIMSFIPAYGMRAAGDAKFSMITSCCTMWACRFCLCVFLIRVMGFGPMGVWIGMFADWTVRSIIFTWRFHSRKWLEHKVI